MLHSLDLKRESKDVKLNFGLVFFLYVLPLLISLPSLILFATGIVTNEISYLLISSLLIIVSYTIHEVAEARLK